MRETGFWRHRSPNLCWALLSGSDVSCLQRVHYVWATSLYVHLWSAERVHSAPLKAVREGAVKFFCNSYPRAGFISGILELGKEPCLLHLNFCRHKKATVVEDVCSYYPVPVFQQRAWKIELTAVHLANIAFVVMAVCVFPLPCFIYRSYRHRNTVSLGEKIEKKLTGDKMKEWKIPSK